MIKTEFGYDLLLESGPSINLNEDYSYNLAFQQSYVGKKLGALICWNMPTFVDAEYANPDIGVNTFNPSGLDVSGWIDSVVAMNGKYAILTMKHHDGFALWPTNFAASGCPVYGVSQTNWYATSGSPDIARIFVDQCRIHNISPGFYFSMRDNTFEFRIVGNQVGNTAAYISMIQTQLAELLTRYGPIDIIWFDGWGWDLGYSYITYSTIYNFVKNLSPRTVIVENSHTHPTITSEIEVYEQIYDPPISYGNTRLSEFVESCRIDQKWFYGVSNDQTSASYSASSVKLRVNDSNTKNASFLLGITPGTDGQIPSAQATFLSQLKNY